MKKRTMKNRSRKLNEICSRMNPTQVKSFSSVSPREAVLHVSAAELGIQNEPVARCAE